MRLRQKNLLQLNIYGCLGLAKANSWFESRDDVQPILLRVVGIGGGQRHLRLECEREPDIGSRVAHSSEFPRSYSDDGECGAVDFNHLSYRGRIVVKLASPVGVIQNRGGRCFPSIIFG